MKNLILATTALAGALAMSTATAAPAISAEVGTTGLGLHLTLPVSANLNSRIGFNVFSFDTSRSTDDAEYDAKLKLNTIDALLDYHPMTGSGLRLTGGLVYNNNRIDVTARPTGSSTYTFNGNLYNASQVGEVDGRIDFRKVAPYLGFGWGNAPGSRSGWSFTSDFGVMFQGSPNTSLTNRNCTLDVALCNRLAGDLEAENRELQDDADSFRFYPVVRIGVSYRF